MKFFPDADTLLKERDALNRKLLMLSEGKGRYYLFFSGTMRHSRSKRFLGVTSNHHRLPYPTGKAL